MVLFKKKVKPGDYELQRDGAEDVLHINYDSYPRIASIEDDALVMSYVIEALSQNPSVNRIIFHQKKKYEYGHHQTVLLVEIATIYNHFIKQKKFLSQAALEVFGPIEDSNNKIKNLQYIILNLLKTDPIGAFVESKRFLREEKINLLSSSEDYKIRLQPYIILLSEIYNLLANTKLLSLCKDKIDGYETGSRDIYKSIFKPSITPDFMYTRLISTPPLNAQMLDSYSVGKNVNIQIFNTKDNIKPLYHITPPEFLISEDKYELLDLARKVLSEHQPKAEEFLDVEKMRETFFNIGKDLLTELADNKNISLTYPEIEELAQILVRYTVGFGLIESLLMDDNIQDIAINSPAGVTSIFVVHGKYDECITNIVPSIEDVESWASKFRLISARPLDEANPVLDTELSIPGARARIAVITRPLNPTGLAFSIRRHRDKPWTLALFIKNNMISDLGAGLLSFFIDGARTLLIAGTRGSGKTSLIGSVLVEIMRKYRIIVVEDSVTGDAEILVKKGNKIEKTTIGNLVDSSINKYRSWYDLSDSEVLGNDENIEVLSKTKQNKVIWAKPTRLIRHKVNKRIYEIRTRTGRIIKVTEDHSLFSLDENTEVSEIKPTALRKGSFIAVPRKIPFNEKDIFKINLLEYLDKLSSGFIEGESLKVFIKENYQEIKQLSREHKYTRSMVPRWARKGIIPIKILKDLDCLNKKIQDCKDLYFKNASNAERIPIIIDLNEDILTSVGIWLADGCYDKRSIIFSTFDIEDRDVVNKVADYFNFETKIHSDGGSHMINSSSLRTIFREVLELKGDAYTKKVPNWVFNLSKKQISFVIKGLISGDGHVSKNEISISLCSRQLLKDLQTLLLGFELNLRINNKMKEKDKTYHSTISSVKNLIAFKENIGLLQGYKKKDLNILCKRISTHDTTDIIPLNLEFKRSLKEYIKKERIFNGQDYIKRDNNVGREKLKSLLSQEQIQEFKQIENLKLLAYSDIFWDEVLEINILELGEINVYDLSIPESESFICNNMILHNTAELPVSALSKMNYNIQPMKVRSALLKSGSELSADEGIRTSLRMGDSALIMSLQWTLI
ncbi:MAG: hypothetical protein QT09_C0010G0012 [archaeon GW2011_AR18]|nr:MAG: hypothetical protein QT09_C0010G0012 [archaeon GW2011_AR18]